MGLWFCSLLLPLSTVPRRVSRAAIESCPAFISYSLAPAGVVHHGLGRSLGAGHLDCFQVFAVENVHMYASQGALFSWLIEKGHSWFSLCSVPFYLPSRFFPLLLAHPIFIPSPTLLSALSHPFYRSPSLPTIVTLVVTCCQILGLT